MPPPLELPELGAMSSKGWTTTNPGPWKEYCIASPDPPRVQRGPWVSSQSTGSGSVTVPTRSRTAASAFPV